MGTNQGSKWLPEAQTGLNKGWELQNGSLRNYQEIDQAKPGRINSRFVYNHDSHTFWFQKPFVLLKITESPKSFCLYGLYLLII